MPNGGVVLDSARVRVFERDDSDRAITRKSEDSGRTRQSPRGSLK